LLLAASGGASAESEIERGNYLVTPFLRTVPPLD
jgi:hypothetical protein